MSSSRGVLTAWSGATFPWARTNRQETEQGGVENVQHATNHKRKGGGSAHPVCSTRSASHLFLAIFLPGTDFVVVQHLIRGIYHKLEKRQQPLVRLTDRSTSLVSGIVSLDFFAIQVSFASGHCRRAQAPAGWSLSDSQVVNFRAVGKPREGNACFLQLQCTTNLTHPGGCSWMQSQWAHRKDER